MKYIRTKDGHIFEIVDYEQLDENTKKNVRQPRYAGLEDYINETVFVKIHKNMPNPISQYQSVKMFNILKQADTIEELCDEFVFVDSIGSFLISIDWYAEEQKVEKAIVEYECMTLSKPLKDCLKQGNVYCAIWTDKGLIYVAKMNEKGELELL